MTRLLTAVYENGVFRPLEDPGLVEHQKVTVEILAEPETSPDDALAAWQRVYEGLSDEQIREIEEIALDRSHLSPKDLHRDCFLIGNTLGRVNNGGWECCK